MPSSTPYPAITTVLSMSSLSLLTISTTNLYLFLSILGNIDIFQRSSLLCHTHITFLSNIIYSVVLNIPYVLTLV